MKLTTIEVTAPSAWASYLINGDASGLDDSEQSKCDAFVEGYCAPYTCAIGCEDAGFIHHHDAYSYCPLSADCQRYTFANYGRVSP